jgi:hypothetical protein
MAATNKSLAKSNKSDAGGKATKEREIRQPALIQYVSAIPRQNGQTGVPLSA